MSWKSSPRVSQKQLRSSQPLAFHSQRPGGNQGAQDRATAEMGNVKTLRRLREREMVLHRTSRSWPICSQNEVENHNVLWVLHPHQALKALPCPAPARPLPGVAGPALPVTGGSLTAELRCVKGFTDVKPHLDNAWNKSLTFFTQLCTNRFGSSRVETAAPRYFHFSIPVNCLKASPLGSKVELARRRQDSPC